MPDEKRLLGKSEDGSILRSIANTSQQCPKDEKALHDIADRLDLAEVKIERLRAEIARLNDVIVRVYQ